MRRRSVRGLTVTESPFKLDSGAIVRAATTPLTTPFFQLQKRSQPPHAFLCTSASSLSCAAAARRPNFSARGFEPGCGNNQKAVVKSELGRLRVPAACFPAAG